MGNDETVAGKPSSQARFGLAEAEAIAGRYRVVRWLGGGGMGNVRFRREVQGMQLLAELASALGRPDLTLFALERAVTLGLVDLTYLDRCPLFRDLDRERMRTLRESVAARAASVLAAFRTAANAS